ncbi:hypothetical protein M9Y10_018701 [Tritrichomonas musculus]|uniref:Ankyrin repeat protein n=1 Tax=Tritrichomonas musculus TaxID=1915356 RepID=A0ABR2HP59_9EUKA
MMTFSIHGRNAELIHILEENIKYEDSLITKISVESIKCHHNDISNYIVNNIVKKYKKLFDVFRSFNNNLITYGLHYYNYEFMTSNMTHSFTFYNACKYDHISFVKLLFDEKLSKLKLKKIHEKKNFFL